LLQISLNRSKYLVVITGLGNSKMPPKRVRKPSQKAALAAAKVAKPTSNATRAAVTEGLIGAATRALVYAAELSEPPTGPAVVVAEPEEPAEPIEIPNEPDVQTQGIEDPPPAYHLPEAFSYTLNWRVTDDIRRQDVTSDLVTQQSNMHAITVDKVKELNDTFERDHPHFQVVSRKYKAGYATTAEKNWQGTSHLSSFSVLMEHLGEFHHAGKRGLQILVDTRVKITDDPMAAIAAIGGPPRASQARRRTATVPPRPRDTATNRQLEAMPAERAELQAAGNHSGKITDLWKCTSGACGNKGKQCYWTIRNEAPYHFPITRPVLLAWAEGLRDESLTEKQPSVAMLGQMVAAKQLLEGSPRRRAKETPAQGFTQGQTIIYAGAPPPTPVVATLATTALTSSPLRMPSGSPELSNIEKVDAFVAWCKTERCWRGEEVELDFVRLQVREHGESVEGIGNAAVDEWLLLGLKIGYRRRLRASAKKWMAAGMPVPSVIRVEI
jgi:hypothetical protein